jgi:hypothetical protein
LHDGRNGWFEQVVNRQFIESGKTYIDGHLETASAEGSKYSECCRTIGGEDCVRDAVDGCKLPAAHLTHILTAQIARPNQRLLELYSSVLQRLAIASQPFQLIP